jgi:hypothetical protein
MFVVGEKKLPAERGKSEIQDRFGEIARYLGS